MEWCLATREHKRNFENFLQHAVPDISHFFAKFRFQNTHISHVFFSKKNPAIFLIFSVWVALDPICCSPMCCLLGNFFEDVTHVKIQKVSVFSYFLSNITLTPAKKFPNKQHIGEQQIGSSATHTEKIRKIAGFFFEKKTCEICVFWKRNFAKKCEISGTACCKKFSKFLLCSLVARHHSMKFLCNFDHYWWRKNFLNEKHAF